MKMQITVDIKNDDGTLGAEATVIEVDVPDFEAFTGPERFGAVFDEYERKVLKARNEAIASATEKYLREMAKKKTVRERQYNRVSLGSQYLSFHIFFHRDLHRDLHIIFA